MTKKSILMTLGVGLLVVSMGLTSCTKKKNPNTSSSTPVSEVSNNSNSQTDTSSSSSVTGESSSSSSVGTSSETSSSSTSEDSSSTTSEDSTSSSSSSSSSTDDPVTTGVTIKVGAAEAVAMKDVSDYEKGEDTWDKQYEVKVSVKAGDELVFAIDGTVVAEKIGPGPGANNLKLEDDKLIVINDADATVYFKIYPNGGHSVHVTGLDNQGGDPVAKFDTYLYGSMNEWKQNEAYGLAVNEKNEAERFITLELKAKDELKIVNSSKYYGITDVKTGCATLVEGTDNIVIKEDGKYTFYFSTVADEEGNYIWIAKEGSTNPDIPDDPVTEDITLYYVNTNGWATPTIYYWGTNEGVWPGEKMTKVEGENVYSFTISADKGAKQCIFNNNGSNKTADLTIPTDGKNCYYNGEWVTYEKGKYLEEDNNYVTYNVDWSTCTWLFAADAAVYAHCTNDSGAEGWYLVNKLTETTASFAADDGYTKCTFYRFDPKTFNGKPSDTTGNTVWNEGKECLISNHSVTVTM